MPESKKKYLYQGSVKNLCEAGTDKIEFEFSDAYSVFDWGRMPDDLPYKGESLAAIGTYFFQAAGKPETWKKIKGTQPYQTLQKKFETIDPAFAKTLSRELSDLEARGLKHHFLERTSSTCFVVKKLNVLRPEFRSLASQAFFDYKNQTQLPASTPKLIPLECIFRFGIPKGSSLLERLTPEYAKKLGFDSVPKEGSSFETPIIELFSKLEKSDRFLNTEQAFHFSGLSYELFEKLYARTLLVSVWLFDVFKQTGLELWDGKLEWGVSGDELWLVDSIGPDELRLLDPKTGTQISKEFLRLYYRPTTWFEETKRAKQKAEAEGLVDWKKLVSTPPPSLNEQFRSAATSLYPSLALALTGENPGGLGLPLRDMLRRIEQCLKS